MDAFPFPADDNFPRILDAIASPADLKVLTDEELQILACEIRRQILATTSQTGGHVASSLGAVEIILAVHSLIDSPRDRFIFDVGHQSYAHKLVTGRLDGFGSLRKLGGLSGFPKPSESPHDVHPSGHASDSLSIALGLAKARDLRGGTEKIVTLIGDASIAGGMAFEALNQIGQMQTPMVIILNDNEMSISRNVGALMKHFGALRASGAYRMARDTLQDRWERDGNEFLRFALDLGRRAKDSTKSFFIPQAMIFEQLGIICTAPIDGHDIGQLREILKTALAADAPVLIHTVTKKGAGYQPAIDDPERFHGVGAYDLATGRDAKALAREQALAAGLEVADEPPSYTAVFGQAMVNEARLNNDIIALTAAMKSGTGLSAFADEFPRRFMDCGIAEGHAVGAASGLAFGGKKPVVAIYSTFLQRAIDQVIIDASLSDLDIVFAIDRAGLVGNDGPTHHGTFDMVYMRMIPHMRVLAPSNEAELVGALHTALQLGGPFAIRYPRGNAQGVSLPSTPGVFEVGKSQVAYEPYGLNVSTVSILAFGRVVNNAVEAAKLLGERGVAARVVDMRWVKPIDAQAVAAASKSSLVVTVEEGVVSGGAGSAVLEEIARQGLCARVLSLGIPDTFVSQGSVDELFAQLGLDSQGIAAAIRKNLA